MKEYKIFEKNGLIEAIPDVGLNLWALLFGPFYLLYKGMIKWSLLYGTLLFLGVYVLCYKTQCNADNILSNLYYLFISILISYNTNKHYERYLIDNKWECVGTIEAYSRTEAIDKRKDFLKKYRNLVRSGRIGRLTHND